MGSKLNKNARDQITKDLLEEFPNLKIHVFEKLLGIAPSNNLMSTIYIANRNDLFFFVEGMRMRKELDSNESASDAG